MVYFFNVNVVCVDMSTVCGGFSSSFRFFLFFCVHKGSCGPKLLFNTFNPSAIKGGWAGLVVWTPKFANNSGTRCCRILKFIP